MAPGTFHFDPRATGLEVFLGPTEARLMELVWTHGPVTIKKVLFYLGPERTPAYTTVMTVMNRLSEKGLLTREKDGRTFVYRPSVDRAQFLRERVHTVRDCLKRNFTGK